MALVQTKFHLVLVLLTLFTGFAQGGLYTHRIRSLDLDKGIEGCNQYVREAAQQFAQDAGVSVIAASCEIDQVMSNSDGVIAYSAPQSVDIWSTNNSTYGEKYSFYNSRQDCEKNLANESGIVRELTGLKPFLGFCYKTSQIGRPEYRSRIDAVGKSQIQRFESAALIDHQLVDSQETINVLDRQARELGMLPVAWYEGQSFFQKALSAAHYETGDNLNRHRLLGKSYLYFSTLDQCQTARIVFDETRLTKWIGVSACSAAHPKVGFQFNLIWWDKSIGADFAVKSTTIPGTYASLEECQKTAKTVSQELNKEGEPLVGILCGRNSDAKSPYQMEALSKTAESIQD